MKHLFTALLCSLPLFSYAADAPNPTTAQVIPSIAPPVQKYLFQPDGKCALENTAQPSGTNPDIHLRKDANLVVMFHGNRYSVAPELIAAFEKANPKVRVSYTTLPPVNTMNALKEFDSKVMSPELDRFLEISNIEPDVVMLPSSNTVKSLELRGVYSNVHGILMVSRKDDPRGKTLGEALQSDARFVFPGNNPSLPIWKILADESVIGSAKLDELTHGSKVGFSQMKHHRFVPLRIAARCEDVGFQYAHAQKSIEAAYPGVFKFIPVVVPDNSFSKESSSVFITPFAERHKQIKNADLFAKFLLSDKAQAILKKYALER